MAAPRRGTEVDMQFVVVALALTLAGCWDFSSFSGAVRVAPAVDAGAADQGGADDLRERPDLRQPKDFASTQPDWSMPPDLAPPADLQDPWCAPPLVPAQENAWACYRDNECPKERPFCLDATACGDPDMQIPFRNGKCCTRQNLCCTESGEVALFFPCCPGLRRERLRADGGQNLIFCIP